MMKYDYETINLIRRSLKIELLSFGRTVLDERYCTGDWIAQNSFGINRYINGSLYITTQEGREYHIQEGQAVILPDKLIRKGRNDNIGETVSVWHRMHVTVMESIDISLLLDMPFFLDDENSEEVGRINNEYFALEEIKETNFLQYVIKQHLLCMRLFDMVLSVSTLKPDASEFLVKVQRVQPVLEFINKNITHTLVPEELAAILSISVPRLFHIFKKATGLSPGKYLQQQRMRRAQELLLSSDAKIYEIANAVGYDDQFYFSRLFKQNFNLSPEAYRRSFSSN